MKGITRTFTNLLVSNLDYYPNCNEKPLRTFKWRFEIISYTFKNNEWMFMYKIDGV